jgi:hypothetical protein
MPVCCPELGTIEKFCGGVNAPGLERQLGIACGDSITAIPAAVDHLVTGPLTYRTADPNASPAIPAGKFFAWNFAKEDQEFVSEQDENGLWKTSVKIFIAQMTAEKSNVLNNSQGDDKISVVTDRNGRQRLVGSLKEGCSIKVKEQATPKNGYVVEIMWESAHSPYFYSGTITY